MSFSGLSVGFKPTPPGSVSGAGVDSVQRPNVSQIHWLYPGKQPYCPLVTVGSGGACGYGSVRTESGGGRDHTE